MVTLFKFAAPKHRHGNCYGGDVPRGRQNNGHELKDLERQVRKARQLVRKSEVKVEAIETSSYEIEKFYPKIKILRKPDAPRPMAQVVFRELAENTHS